MSTVGEENSSWEIPIMEIEHDKFAILSLLAAFNYYD